ncbi:MAG: histidine kinase N-terminal 7TM domain-containing protein [Caldisericia bacterium]|nr:histidine kinase N-terminal 7TM domain-containing protein [Caldisericia bacterium]
MKSANTYLVLWFFILSAVSFSFAYSTLKKKSYPGWRYFIYLLFFSGAIYLLSSINLFIRSSMMLIALDYTIDTLVTMLPMLWLFYAISYAKNKQVLDNPDLALFFTIPMITILNIWTNEYNAFWYSNRIISKTAYGLLLWVQYQGWFWVHFIYSIILFIIGTFYFLSVLSKEKSIKRYILIFISIGFIALALFECLLGTGLIGQINKSMIVFAYSIAGIIFLVFFIRIDWLDITPFSRSNIFDQMEDYIVVLDSHNRIIDANIAFATWKGIPKADLFGENLLKVFPQWTEEHPLLIEDKQIKYSEDFTSSFGSQFIEVVSLPLIFTGQKMYGRLLVFHDITSLKHNASMKIDFINTISHELRTPLTVIKQAVSYLNSECNESVDSEQKKVLNIAHRNADKLNHMVNNLLEFQNLRQNKNTMHFESYSYNCLIQESLSLLKPWINQSHVRIIEELEPLLPNAEMDIDKMRQVIINLIDNAIRYTEKGHIIIRTNDFATFARIIIEDSGIGLPEEEKTRLDCSLDEFELLILRNRSHIGLGLIISKEIINRHNGSIDAKTKAESGTIITVDMPFVQDKGS